MTGILDPDTRATYLEMRATDLEERMDLLEMLLVKHEEDAVASLQNHKKAIETLQETVTAQKDALVKMNEILGQLKDNNNIVVPQVQALQLEAVGMRKLHNNLVDVLENHYGVLQNNPKVIERFH